MKAKFYRFLNFLYQGRLEVISKGVLAPQNSAPVHSSVVAMALVVPGSPIGLVLVNIRRSEGAAQWRPGYTILVLCF